MNFMEAVPMLCLHIDKNKKVHVIEVNPNQKKTEF